ncbi:MAG: beta-galactosidase, partial [Parapedobacter sp.]
MKRRSIITLVVCLLALKGYTGEPTPRIRMNLDSDWRFHFAYDVRKNAPHQQVTLPHTWNAEDVFGGRLRYYRDMGIYERELTYDPAWKGKRVFLFFEGANSVADVLVNRQFVTQHKGGYTAFCAEITPYLQADTGNTLTVHVSNAARMDVLPLAGDFNVYGGLHRSVWLLVTEENCISPLDYASSGVYIRTEKITGTEASVSVVTKLSLMSPTPGLEVRTMVKDAAGIEVAYEQTTVSAADSRTHQQLVISEPHRWNGKADPYRYAVTVQLLQNKQLVDEVTQPLGLRTFNMDADSGFVLNGSRLDLYGFGRHEDVAGRGSALHNSDHEKDMALIVESGATAMRLTHYPHSRYFYDLADQNGIVLWTEIPLVGPGGYTGTGFINTPELKTHARQLLTELIRQHYNHPSIIFWGLFNELKLDYDDPIPFLTELMALAKKEDPSRIITSASFIDTDHFNAVSDVIAWNKYYGWYGGAFEDIGTWA